MRVRLALGDAALDPGAGCDGDMANPACHDSVVTPPDPDGTLTPGNPRDDDPAVFGRCDPDRPEFANPDPILAQRALDNCLWFFASFPVTAPTPGDFDALHSQLDPRLRPLPTGGLDPLADPFAVRTDAWIDQHVVKYVASTNPIAQEFSQVWGVTYGFKSAPDTDDIESAIYQNDWRMSQSDQGTLTYPYSFIIQHTAEARRRGYTHDPSVLIPECDPPSLPAPYCDGKTNPTVDPFWGEAIVRTGSDLNGDGIIDPVLDANGSPVLDFTRQFEFLDGKPCIEPCAGSGVGHEKEFSFLYEQEIDGALLMSCLNCGHPAPVFSHTVTYTFTWPGLPAIQPVIHDGSGNVIVPGAGTIPVLP
jgi:hypothetical protein